jgi:hypothetical protein
MLSDLNSGKHHNKWSLPGPSCKPHSWKGKRNEFQPPMSAMGSFAIGPSQQEDSAEDAPLPARSACDVLSCSCRRRFKLSQPLLEIRRG